ncbi:MAG: 2-C-methyl-D-erythritol 4-phosphate cytidylyltransferase [Vampirovibrionales bacterium]|nr:2-C-methyl-D-erythritol 4-phosphate cytidylyltransferase [Vampirovibrionales bacterium]
MTWAILSAGGSSQRFGENKLTRVLGGKPLLVWSVETLLSHAAIAGMVIAAPEDLQSDYQALLQPFVKCEKPVVWVSGGSSRRASVYQGLLAVPNHVETVLIHDAARPFLSHAMILDVLEGLNTHNGAIVALPVGDTLKKASMSHDKNQPVIGTTVPREMLWQAQTPQAFKRFVLKQAHELVGKDETITDDAQLLELAHLGPVALVQGSAQNIKLTHPNDWPLAEAIASLQP